MYKTRRRGRGRHWAEGPDDEMQIGEGHQHREELQIVSADTTLLLSHWLFLTDNPWITHLKIHCPMSTLGLQS